jgi:signal transduction histidine kinase
MRTVLSAKTNPQPPVASDALWRSESLVGAFPLIAIGVAGAVATALTAWAVSRSPVLVDPKDLSFWRSLVVASWVGIGLYTWWRRPGSRLGPLFLGNGFLYAATSFNASGASPAHTFGMVMWAVYVVYTAYVLLCYPRGRLETRLERTFIRAYALSTAVLTGLTLALSPTFPPGGSFTNCGTRCPANTLAVGDAATGTALNSASSIVFTIALIGLAMLLFDKARRSGPLMRRAVTPVAAVFGTIVAWFVISLYIVPAYPATGDAVTIVNGVLGLAAPMAILLGQVWGDRFAATSLGQIAVRAGDGPQTPSAVQDVLADALGDSTVTLALWDGDSGYVDVDGEPVEFPVDPQVRSVTYLSKDAGRPVAALIHDPMLDTDSALVEGLAASSLIMLENARLVEELGASRARLVTTADRERRKVERDLHDGAQQRLVAIQIKLGLLRDRVADPTVLAELDEIETDASAAVAELRSLAHGIYPTVLRERGLAEGVRSYARVAPIRVDVVDHGVGRCAPAVEAAVYFCSIEAVQNAVKHAGPDARVTVTFARSADDVRFAIIDDGAGFEAHGASEGVGLVNMRDRIGAVSGELEINSAPGHGTTVGGAVPLGQLETASETTSSVQRS